MSSFTHAKYAYALSIIGVGLVAVTALLGAFRAMMFRPAFRVAVNGTRQFAGSQFGSLFGLTNFVSILGIVIAIAGLVWLGLVLRQPQKGAT